MALWLGLSRPPGRAAAILGVIGLFALIGIIHHRIIGSRHDRWWVKYTIITVDVALLAAVLAFAPLSEGGEVPQILAFRNDTFHYFYIVLAVAAFSLAPGLVLWAGAVISACWLAAWTWIVAGMDRTVSWTDMPPAPSAQEYLAVLLDPDFTGGGSRVQEAVALLVTSVVLALAVQRARHIVMARAVAEAERDLISRTFGQYVPEEVARALVADRGVLRPNQRYATVLFLDIEGFTSIAEPMAPGDVIAMLNGFFDAVARIITGHRGVIISFMGDAVMATFNIPVDDPGHAANALEAALEIDGLASGRTFQGVTLSVRIGINTGLLAAGSVGGGGRQAYTVYGDTVNLAARLEAANKDIGTRLLVSEATVNASAARYRFKAVGTIPIRGKQGAVSVYTIA